MHCSTVGGFGRFTHALLLKFVALGHQAKGAGKAHVVGWNIFFNESGDGDLIIFQAAELFSGKNAAEIVGKDKVVSLNRGDAEHKEEGGDGGVFHCFLSVFGTSEKYQHAENDIANGSHGQDQPEVDGSADGGS